MQRHPNRVSDHSRYNNIELGIPFVGEEHGHAKGIHNTWYQRQIRRLCYTGGRSNYYFLWVKVFVLIALLAIVVLCITRTLGIRLRPKIRKSAISVANKTNILYPPPSIKVSVIIMNHARPNLLQHSDLLPVLTQHPTISEILILQVINYLFYLFI